MLPSVHVYIQYICSMAVALCRQLLQNTAINNKWIYIFSALWNDLYTENRHIFLIEIDDTHIRLSIMLVQCSSCVSVPREDLDLIYEIMVHKLQRLVTFCVTCGVACHIHTAWVLELYVTWPSICTTYLTHITIYIYNGWIALMICTYARGSSTYFLVIYFAAVFRL